MNPSETAVAHFMQGYNCAQATAAAFADRIGLDEKTVLRLTAGFGAGMGGLRGTCGSVSAMVFVAGAVWGGYAPDDRAAKKALYEKVKLMVGRFKERHGTTDCAELLRSAACVPAPDPSERNSAYYAKRPCARFVATAAEIIAESLPQAEPAGAS
jgi:C_GCAxxG_C_C family probable redox protein